MIEKVEKLGKSQKLTRLTLHVDWLVSLNEDCHRPE